MKTKITILFFLIFSTTVFSQIFRGPDGYPRSNNSSVLLKNKITRSINEYESHNNHTLNVIPIRNQNTPYMHLKINCHV